MRKPISVVMVEDHVALREATGQLLGRWGHVITGSAADAEAGYELILSVRPDVAIIDLGLPGETGAQLTRRLLSAEPELRILLYTGTEDPDRISEALDCGACGFALKAGPSVELIEAIRVLADGGTYMDPRLSPAMLARSTTDRVHALSPREREILALLADGLTGVEAGKRLFLSPETIRTHVRNAMTKLEAHTRVHAVALALREREISTGRSAGPGGSQAAGPGSAPA